MNSSGTELGSQSFSPSLHIHDRESDMAGEGGQDWTLATVDSARAKAKSRIPHSVQHQLKGDAGSKGKASHWRKSCGYVVQSIKLDGAQE